MCTTNERELITKNEDWFTNDEKRNPAFHDFFKIYVPYCSSDVYRGTRASSNATDHLYFYGREIVKAVKDSLANNFNLKSADVAILAGSSAGGLGTWMNCDEFFDGVSKSTDARCVVDSGAWIPWWFPPESCLVDTLAWMREWIKLQGLEFDPKCTDKLSKDDKFPIRCALLSSAYSYVKRPLFIMEHQIDVVFMTYVPVLCPFNNLNLFSWLEDWKNASISELRHAALKKT